MRGKVIDKTYRKHEKESGKIRFVKPDGAWSINLQELPIEKMSNGDISRIEFLTEKYVYSTSSQNAIAKGFRRVFCEEEKLVLPLQYWDKKDL